MEEHPIAYNIPGVIHLKGNLDYGALERSIQQGARRRDDARLSAARSAGTHCR